MTDEEKIKDYDRLQYEYAQIHQEYRRLSERQTPTEANNNAETKQLIIADVSKQRELLIAYTEYLAQQDITTSTYWLEVYNVDAFLKSNL